MQLPLRGVNGSALLRFLPFPRMNGKKAGEQAQDGGPVIASKLVVPLGLAISCIAHIAFLGPALIFAGGSPFNTPPADAITVDIVSQDEVDEASKPAAAPTDPTLPFDAKAAAAPSPAAAPPQAGEPLPQPQQESAPTASALQQDRTLQHQAEAQTEPAEPARPPAAWLPPQFALAPTEPEPHDPTAADMFAMPLTLPGGRIGYGYQGAATEKANIAADAVAAFRSHLKTCSLLPAEVTAKARVTLRILLNPDGTLVYGPDQNPRPVGNIYGMPNGGGGELLNAAIAAVRKCQPYKMLPPDKYDEWKAFDITFTRENF
jgi:hypothetical protein